VVGKNILLQETGKKGIKRRQSGRRIFVAKGGQILTVSPGFWGVLRSKSEEGKTHYGKRECGIGKKTEGARSKAKFPEKNNKANSSSRFGGIWKRKGGGGKRQH